MNRASMCNHFAESEKKSANTSQESNNSYRLHTSSLISSDHSISTDLSFSFSNDRELDALINTDELPAFEIRLISPLGRTPSPIDSELATSPCRFTPSPRHNNPDFVALQDINSQISPPSDVDDKAAACLETIFEGVVLNTPPTSQSPRYASKSKSRSRSRISLFEIAASNRNNIDKENRSPSSMLEIGQPN